MSAVTKTALTLHENGLHDRDQQDLARLAAYLPPLLSVIAGMVDVTGFLTLGGIFTAHVTGNLAVAAAVVVGGGAAKPAQLLAIPVFMLAVACTWLVGEVSGRHGARLARLLLLVQFLLIAAVLIFGVATRPSLAPHERAAGVAVLIAVSAMACQFALLRIALPSAVSTAVMTGNLTNAVLSLMDLLSKRRPMLPMDRDRLRKSLYLLSCFLLGCAVSAGAVSLMEDWAWLLPAALSGAAIFLTL